MKKNMTELKHLPYLKSTVILVLFIIIIFIMLMLTATPSIKIKGQIIPVREWIVQKSDDGNISETLFNYQHGLTEKYRVWQLERGDIGVFNLNTQIFESKRIKKGDAIAAFFSNELNREILQLKSELTIAQNTLNLYKSGEKKSIVEAAKSRLNTAILQEKLSSKFYNRQRELFEKNLISQQLFEDAKTTNELDAALVAEARAEVASLQSGDKVSLIRVQQSRIEQISEQLKWRSEIKNDLQFVSPVSGKILQSGSSDTVIIVADTSRLLVRAPIAVSDLAFLDRNATVKIYPGNGQPEIRGEIDSLNPMVRSINGQACKMISIVLSEPLNELGQTVKCKIILSNQSLPDKLRRFFLKVRGNGKI